MSEQTTIEAVKVKKRLGRPRKYGMRLIKIIAKNFNDWLDLKRERKEIIWLKDFLFQNGLNYDNHERFCEISPTYKRVAERAKQAQEISLCEYATQPKANPIFPIFALKNLCGWGDTKQEKQTTTYAEMIEAKPYNAES